MAVMPVVPFTGMEGYPARTLAFRMLAAVVESGKLGWQK
jgi:hypothetical protein